MSYNLIGRSLDTMLNFSTEEVKYLIDFAIELKKQRRSGLHINNKPLVGKNIAVIFQKDSTRTRSAFEVAAFDTGMGVTYIGPSGSNFGKKESVADTARVLGRFYDGIEFRGFKQSDIDDLVKYANVPIWNGLTDAEHPTQLLADFMTMKEQLGELKGKKVVFTGDYKNNMGITTMLGAAFMGMHMVMCGPDSYKKSIDKKYIQFAEDLNKINGGTLTFESDKLKAAKDADAICTDVWVSLGEDFSLFDSRIKELQDFQVDMKMIEKASKNVIFLHCLPAFHDLNTQFSAEVSAELSKKYPLVKNGEMEVTNEVFESRFSKVFDQAENRMHTIKAVMLATLGY